jgi:hypothetical protein
MKGAWYGPSISGIRAKGGRDLHMGVITMVIGTWSSGSWESRLGNGGVLPSLKGVTTIIVDSIGQTLTHGLNGGVAKENNASRVTIDF